MAVLKDMIKDYFAFIYPTMPVPHKGTFMAAFEKRQDQQDPKFLALIAAMVGCLGASMPRRVYLHLHKGNVGHIFDDSRKFIEHCYQFSKDYLNPFDAAHESDVYTVITHYLRGVTAEYMFDRDQCLLHLKFGISISTSLGLHKASTDSVTNAQVPRMTPNGQALDASQSEVLALIEQELGKRVWWLLVGTVESLYQLGCSSAEISLPIANATHPYPAFPREVDDEDLARIVLAANPGTFSKLVGFNRNTEVYQCCLSITKSDIIHGVNVVYDWDIQKNAIQECLGKLRTLIEVLPDELRLGSTAEPTEANDQGQLSTPVHTPVAGPGPAGLFNQFHANGVRSHNEIWVDVYPKYWRIQQANIYSTYLATRAYLVEKYFALKQYHAQSNGDKGNAPSPGSDVSSPGGPGSTTQRTTSAKDAMDAEMENERIETMRDFNELLQRMDVTCMEPQAAPLVHKFRSIAFQLLFIAQKQQILAQSDAEGNDNPSAQMSDDYISAINELQSHLEVMDTSAYGGSLGPGRDRALKAEYTKLKDWTDWREEHEGFARMIFSV